MEKNRKRAGRVLAFLGVLMFAGSFLGCGIEKTSPKKLKDIEFTVIEQSQIPEELLNTIEEKKKDGFKLTYADKENLYVTVGYGKQKTGGYSISVDACYLTENAIYFKTTLTGPKKGEKINKVPSYPYIVIKTKCIDEPVVFE